MADERAPATGGEAEAESRKGAPPRDPKKSKKMRLLIIAGVVVAGVILLVWWLNARKFEDTDDAQIDGNIISVSPRVPGTVVAVHVVDNQQVKAGDPLVELDPTDLAVAL